MKALHALAVIACAGCASTAHVYPANDIAAKTGVIEFHYTSWGTGHVRLTGTMPDGELLSGEATVVRGGSAGFGTITSQVYGPGGAASAYGTGFFSSMSRASPAQADVMGSKGSIFNCELYNDNFSGHGYGACKSPNGALYRVQY